jgi:hypothetical protein
MKPASRDAKHTILKLGRSWKDAGATLALDPAAYPDHSTPDYAAPRGLYEHVRQLCAQAFDEPHTSNETILG